MSKTEPNSWTVEVDGLKKWYGAVPAVKGIDFKVARGEIVGFLGPNGAGKSTVLKILTCYLSATQGRVKVAGHDVYTEPLKVRRKVGYQPENVPLYDEMVVHDYLVFMAKMRGVSRARRLQRVRTVAESCGILPVMGRLIRELSKGFRQRVGLAQALVHDPEVIILDEPMAGLDPNQIIEIRDLIRETGREKTVIFSSHILQEIEKLCDRVLIIDKGLIVADGSVPELRGALWKRPRLDLRLRPDGLEADAVEQQLEEAGAEVVRLSPLGDEPENGALAFRITVEPADGESAADPSARVVALADDQGWDVLELRQVLPSLEDVFQRLTHSQESVTAARARRQDAPGEEG
jgi:ABC-2 type transport system ATP-binding protein